MSPLAGKGRALCPMKCCETPFGDGPLCSFVPQEGKNKPVSLEDSQQEGDVEDENGENKGNKVPANFISLKGM